MQYTEEVRTQEAEELKKTLEQADYKVFTLLRHVSKSGMQRHISLIAIVDNHPLHISYPAALVLNRRVTKKGETAVIVNGVGMDMGFELVYSLSQLLYGDGRKLSHSWL